MTIEITGFAETGSIIATIDGVQCSVPDDMSNRDRRMIWDEWEMAPAPPGTPDDERQRANTIPPYVPPPAPSPYHPLKPYQFWGAVRATGHETELRDWVAAMPDPVQRGIASAMLDYSLEFRFDHPLMEPARLHLGMTLPQFQDLWLWGMTL